MKQNWFKIVIVPIKLIECSKFLSPIDIANGNYWTDGLITKTQSQGQVLLLLQPLFSGLAAHAGHFLKDTMKDENVREHLPLQFQ